MIDFKNMKTGENLGIELQNPTTEQKRYFRGYAANHNDVQNMAYIDQAAQNGILLTLDMVAITAKEHWGKHNGKMKQADREAFQEAKELGLLKVGIAQTQVTGAFQTRLDDITTGTKRSNKDVLIINGVAEEDTARLLAKPCKSKINAALVKHAKHPTLQLIQNNENIGKRQMKSISDNKFGAALSNLEGMANVVSELARLHMGDVEKQSRLDAYALEMAQMEARMARMEAELADTINVVKVVSSVVEVREDLPLMTKEEKADTCKGLSATGKTPTEIYRLTGISLSAVKRYIKS